MGQSCEISLGKHGYGLVECLQSVLRYKTLGQGPAYYLMGKRVSKQVEIADAVVRFNIGDVRQPITGSRWEAYILLYGSCTSGSYDWSWWYDGVLRREA